MERIDRDAPSSRASPKLRAFAVLEEDEGTGGIVFARHAVAARRRGANKYANGEVGYVRCNRAPWADAFADGRVPAAVMVENGWHFECGGCGIKIDSDMPYEHDKPVSGIIGHQHSMVFCDADCQAWYKAERAEAARRQDRAIDRFKRIVRRRFPDVEFMANDEHHIGRVHAYVSRRPDGHWRVGQVVVSFAFPGMEYGPAYLRYDNSYGRLEKPHYSVCAGDREAFERFINNKKAPTPKQEP